MNDEDLCPDGVLLPWVLPRHQDAVPFGAERPPSRAARKGGPDLSTPPGTTSPPAWGKGHEAHRWFSGTLCGGDRLHCWGGGFKTRPQCGAESEAPAPLPRGTMNMVPLSDRQGFGAVPRAKHLPSTPL